MTPEPVPMFRTTTVYQNADGSLIAIEGYLTAASIDAAHRHAAVRIAQWSDAISITIEDDT